jgi:hypothetical protein
MNKRPEIPIDQPDELYPLLQELSDILYIPDYLDDDFLAAIRPYIAREREEVRKQTARDILSLANEYANQDPTVIGSENIRGYHYFNAINKIGGFRGR